MRILRPLATAALLVTSAAACATDGDDGGRPDDVEEDIRSGGKGDGETCDFAAMSAATYYAQFAYKAEDSENWARYRIGGTWDLTGTLDNGDEVDLDVYFLANDRVIVEYEEEHRLDSSRSEVLNKTVIVTRARIDATTRAITIDGVGSGTPLTVSRGGGSCSPGIAFTFSSDIRSPGLKNDNAVIQGLWTSAYVIDPDHLDEVPSEAARRYFQEDVASGEIQIQRK